MAMQSGFIKRIRDIMRMDAGINGDAQRIEQMVWMLFLKVYDAKEDDWELNEDNDEELFVNRCKESEHFYLLDEVRKETIIKHIKAYDYVAALQIAGEMTEPFDDDIETEP